MILQQAVTNRYEVLNVSSTANQTEIAAAYQQLIRPCHPDMIKSVDPAMHQRGEDRFKVLTAAYQVLDDPSRRILDDKRLLTKSGTFRVTYADTVHDSRAPYRLDDAWKAFISQPLDGMKKGVGLYLHWEWAALLAAATIIILIATGQLTSHSLYSFALTTVSIPGETSFVPLICAVSGIILAGIGIGFLSSRAMFDHPYSAKYNPKFKAALIDRIRNDVIITMIVSTFVGTAIGHYFF